MKVALIVAVAQNGVIGNAGKLPWRLPDEMAWFRSTTMGHHVIMGRRTFESLAAPLRGRTNVVVSRSLAARDDVKDVTLVSSLPEGLSVARAAGESEAFVIGGAQLYAEALPLCHRIYLTEVLGAPAGDAVFPALDRSQWHEVSARTHPADALHQFAFRMCVLERKASP